MKEFFIQKGWEKTLHELGLDSLESMLAFSNDGCKSVHRRGATFRITLPEDEKEHLFLKCDYMTYKKVIIKDLLAGKHPAQNTVKERTAFDYARNAGFIVPEVIAWGSMTRWGLPSKAAMVMREIHGISLHELIMSGKQGDFAFRAEALLLKMFNCGFDWPDYKPEHFIIMPDERIALIDLERLVVKGEPLSKAQIAERIDRFHRLVDKEIALFNKR